jgi:hypothetical protein
MVNDTMIERNRTVAGKLKLMDEYRSKERGRDNLFDLIVKRMQQSENDKIIKVIVNHNL